MELTLKQAHRLDLEISEAINSLASKLPAQCYNGHSIKISIYENVTQTFESLREKAAMVQKESLELIKTRYEIRKLISTGKQVSGLNDVLTSEVCDKELITKLMQLSKLRSISLDETSLVEQRLSTLKETFKQATSLTRSTDYIESYGFMDEDSVNAINAQIKELKKSLIAYKDTTAALNNTTKITLPVEVVETLRKFNLV